MSTDTIVASRRSREESRFIPGEEGVWVFVLGDMMVFGCFFLVFLYYRGFDPEGFNAAQATLNVNLGALNTILLLTGSWFVATAVEKLRAGQANLASRYFWGGWACGAGFSIVKIIEYREKVGEGYTLITNDFFMYYYVLTGIHFLHLIVGMGVLTFLALKARAATADGDMRLFEAGGVYWHMVDLLWIVLFPLIYLVR